MQLLRIQPASVGLMWPKVRHWIKAAMQRGDLDQFKPVEDAVLNGHMLLWVACDEEPRAAAVTSFVDTDARRVLLIVACGGSDMDGWIPLLNEIEDFARISGCDATRIIGREGWKRVLPDYLKKRVILEKALGHG